MDGPSKHESNFFRLFYSISITKFYVYMIFVINLHKYTYFH